MKTENGQLGTQFLINTIKQQNIPVDIQILRTNQKRDGLVSINNNNVVIEIKIEITPAHITAIKKHLQEIKNNEYLLVLANYISPEAKQLLKLEHINYLDKAGNMWLSLPKFTMIIDGNKNAPLQKKYSTRAFTKTGAAVVFQFLMDPGLINAPQRKIAEFAGVSLGTIPKVLEGLHKDGFIIKVNEYTWKYTNFEQLLLKWTDVLQDKLLPANYIQQYRPMKISAKQLLKANTIKGNTQWGGEPAAALLSNYLLPENYTLFTDNAQDLIKKYKLVPDPNGEIAVYKKFWKHSTYKEQHVHPILVYAQLMASGDSRNIETAEKLYDELSQIKL